LEIGGREWVSVHTPGHTQDHLCLWDPTSRVMISGDHVLPTITPHISGMGITADPLADFFRSLDRMQTFGPATVLPAHGLEFSDLTGRAEDIKIHHHERLETLRRAGDGLGRATVEQYMRSLFQERSWGPMAESETYAHLEHLRLLKQAKVSTDGEQLRYQILG
jgi:glyoxylase-like metal-dependent hydrolase (beta-lactamase superfamily II)